MSENSQEKIGHYVCAFVDILGQKGELSKLDNITSLSDQDDEVVTIFKSTYGQVKKFRELMSDSSRHFNSMATKYCEESPKIKTGFFSDLTISYLSLSKDGKDPDICRLLYMLFSLSEVFLTMLASRVPLRGGIDVGYGIESDEGQLYGNALSKAYHLETNIAQSIRIVIGQGLVEMLKNASEEKDPKISAVAKLTLEYIIKDTDDLYILDYLSKSFQDLSGFKEKASGAKKFLEDENNRLRKVGDHKTASKYEKALNYFERSSVSVAS